MMKIKQIKAREIFDSRGFPTVECYIYFDSGVCVSASVPSGASVGKDEAVELRDGDEKRFNGKGVLTAIKNIEQKIAPGLIGRKPDVAELDAFMIDLDGTSNKANLGANATLAVSIAVMRGQAHMENLHLFKLISNIFNAGLKGMPRSMFNIINGGMHANNGLVFQEFMIMPKTTSLEQSLHTIFLIYQSLKELLSHDGYLTSVGDEGGFAPHFQEKGLNKERIALDYMMRAVEKAGLTEQDIDICLDVAATHFYDSNFQKYIIEGEELTSLELISFYQELIKSYPIVSIEDGVSELDWDGWVQMTRLLGKDIMLVGDDIFVTSPEKINLGARKKVANAALIKPNQRGTILETIKAFKATHENDYKSVVSHRSGETNDSFIADLAVGGSAQFFKAGACARGERVAKYNRLLKIEGFYHG